MRQLRIALIITTIFLAGCSGWKKGRYTERGDRYFKAGDYDSAKIEYMNLLRVDSRGALPFERLGQMWLEDGDFFRAGAFLQRAREINPNNVANRLRLARAFFGIGQLANAHKELVEVLQMDPANGEALFLAVGTVFNKETSDAIEGMVAKFPNKQDPYYSLTQWEVALRNRDLPSAGAAARQAVASNPNLAATHTAVAALHLSEGKVKEAGDELKIASDKAPLRSPERLKYAEFLSQTNQRDEAYKVLRDLTGKAKDFIGGWNLLGKMEYTDKKFDESLATLENVFSRDPDNVDGRLTQVDNWIAKSEAKKASATLDGLNTTFPNMPAVKFRRALIDLQANNPSQAISELEQAVSANPNYLEAIMLLAKVRLQTGNFQRVIESMEELLKRQPTYLDAQITLADAYRAAGRFDDAAAIMNQLIAANPKESRYDVFLGLIRRSQNQLEEAGKAFDKAVEVNPGDTLALDQRIDLAIQAKDFAGAHARAQQLITKDPQSGIGYYLEGKIFVAEQKHEEGQATLNKAISLDPKLSEAYNVLVGSYVTSNKLPQAVSEIEKVLQQNPRNSNALLVSGLIYDRLKDAGKGKEAYEKYLNLVPDSPVALNNLAFLYSKDPNQRPKALELARKAQSLAPADPSIADTLGWILYQSGDYQQAVEKLRASVDKAPQNGETQFHFGMASYMMGQTEQAKAALQKAIEGAGDAPWKAEAVERLNLVQSGKAPPASTSPSSSAGAVAAGDPIALTHLADNYEAQGDHKKAAETYEKAYQANPRLAEPPLKLAQLYAGPLADPKRALEFARKAREAAPTDAKTTAIVGRVAYDAGNFQWSYSLLQDAVRQLAQDETAQRDFGLAAYSMGRIAEARAAMQRVIEAGGQLTSEAKSFLSLLDLEADPSKASAAAAEISAALQKDPKNVPALMAKAIATSDRNAGMQLYGSVLERFPEFAPAQMRLAALYAADPGMQSQAEELALKARRTMGDDPAVSSVLGAVAYAKKDYARVVQTLQGADTKAPLDPTHRFYLGMALIEQGKKPEGIGQLQKALASGLEGQMSRDAKAAIQKASH